MRKFLLSVVVCALAIGLAGTSAAQQQEPAEVTRVFFVKPKPGMELQFEEAFKKHADWHRQKNDSWRWDVRYTSTGRSTGEYIIITGGHQWKDFDNPPVPGKDDADHFFSTVSQFLESWSSSLLTTRRDLTRAEPGTPASPIATVVYFHLKYGQTGKFVDAQRQIREAQDKTNAPVRATWYQLSSTGVNATFVVSIPRENWAAFELPGGPSPRDRIEQTFGRARAEAIYQALDESVSYTEAKVTIARPDLSYIPAGSK
jgi:hypothetical protein